LVKGAVCRALKVGYHHIDCAPVYGNQKEVGEGLKEGLQKNGMKQTKFFFLSESISSYVAHKLV
jgi:diketogulonate reductase-like aldo/keto reductase